MTEEHTGRSAAPNAAGEKAVTGWVVSHTHWDREWYWPFQSFRRRLVKVVDAVLDTLENDAEFASFTLDGQSIVLEDYLAIRPENRARLAALVVARRLFVGPWYVLPDEFLVSGEALVRNVLIGSAIARSFGNCLKAGYIPDPFGHIAQLPQILDGFGLGACFFCRGAGAEHDNLHTEFHWEALDGTTVLGIHQRHGYCNLAALGYERWWQESGADDERAAEQIEKAVNGLADLSSTGILLLNNGCDHLMPQRELPRLLKYANEKLGGVNLVHGNFEDYVRAVQAEEPELGTHRGEMRWGKFNIILPGVWSSRMYLKQANERTQTAVETLAEPASAVAWLHGRRYETDFLTEAWKILLSNHPHDSICGCSVDEVHRAMMPRFEEAQRLARDVADDSLAFMERRLDTRRPEGIKPGADPATHRALVAFNGLGQPWAGVLKATVEIPVAAGGMGTGGAPRYLRVLDADGTVLPSQMTAQRIHESYGGHAGDKLVWQVDLEWFGEVPACGHTVFHIEEAKHGHVARLETDLAAENDRLANENISVLFQPNGTFHVYRQDWPFYVNSGLLEDTEDAGDAYNYSPAFTSKTVTSLGAATTIFRVANGPVRAAFEIRQTLRVPASLSADRMGRSEAMVDMPVVTTVSLEAGARRVDVETRVTNTAKDHRLRVLFETAERPERVFADTAFGVVRRPISIPETVGWEENPTGTWAMQRWFAVEGRVEDFEGYDDEEDEDDEDGEEELAPHTGVAILAQGLPEYEAMLGDASTTMALTLFRSVGWMARGGALSRPQSAGPRLPAPDAQCLGDHVFRYSICPYEGTWEEANVPNEALAFVSPPTVRMVEEAEGDIPPVQSYVALEPENLVLSAVKKADDRDAMLVRLYNPTDEALNATVHFHDEPTKVEAVKMDETTPDARVSVLRSGDTASFRIPGSRVVTLAVTFPNVNGGEMDEWTAVPGV